MIYKTKSVVISRGKRKLDNYPALISLFSVNDPHLKNQVPDKVVEQDLIEKVKIKGKEVDFFMRGADVVVNNLKSIDVQKKGPELIITVKG